MKYSILLLLIVTAIVMTSCTKPTESTTAVISHYKIGIYDIGSNTLTIIRDFGELVDMNEPNYALFHPDGSKIVYYLQGSLFTIDIDGSNELKISGDLDVDEDFPFATVNGVYFAAYVDENRDIMHVRWDGSSIDNITCTPGSDECHPYINCDRQKMLYVSIQDTVFSLAEHDIDSGKISALYVNAERTMSYPAYINSSPDILLFMGSRLSCLHFDPICLDEIASNSSPSITGQLTIDKNSHYTIFSGGYAAIVDLASAAVTEVLYNCPSARYPSISKSGSFIVVSSGSNNRSYIISTESTTIMTEIAYGYYARMSDSEEKLLSIIRY